ncbi:protein POLLEN DEFECTIVE IN GUIDANCE 1 [Olea europaea var. sylvestris]|uniref:protein POLLEN DEFECTIVE IN GUIDANCE 1 n=1 Tax=Olea europaea var. sylvestris TaxID=158386 RepID=UPI000C1D76E5|nr:protein POLLEN DEFECTIVE IN GUIDANCE 1 [Olea europaea var. sylvestris]
MGSRSEGRNLSFKILSVMENGDVSPTTTSTLSRSNSDPPSLQNDESSSPTHNNRKKKKRKNKRGTISASSPFSENSETNRKINYNILGVEYGSREFSYTVVQKESAIESVAEKSENDSAVSTATGTPLVGPPLFGELRQRNVSSVVNGGDDEMPMSLRIEESRNVNSDNKAKEEVDENQSVLKESNLNKRTETNGKKLEKEESLDWKKLMSEDQNYSFPVEKSPVKYFMEEMNAGNSLRSTTTPGNDKERERVYDTIFRLPWRCELLINVGFFVCLDSFLSLLTIMPARIITYFWKLLRTRQFKKLSSAELSDLGCLVVLVTGVALLQQTDISLIYHMIRGQGTIKLYVVYNVLEIFDKLFQSFGGDVMQALFNSAAGLATSSPENMQFWLWRFFSDEVLAVATSIVHSFVLLAQAITLSTCIVAHNNALFAMLVSNNFAEIKSNVFKRYSKANVHSLVYLDSVERFHILAFILSVLAQNILEAEGPWFESFLFNALVVYLCEVMIDVIKHSFIAKFNDIKPIAFSEFLEDLCKQTLNQTDNEQKNLTFVPLAPACVVIRVLSPVYSAHLPYGPCLWWRLFCMFVLFMPTFLMLASLKVMIGMGLQKHARWYVDRCQKRKLHTD